MQRIQLRTLELKVHMCCNKCAEIVTENIREVEGKCTLTTLPWCHLLSKLVTDLDLKIALVDNLHDFM